MKKTRIFANRLSFLDPSVFIGLTGAFLFIGAAMMMGGSFSSFINKPSLLIVFGGTFFACLASFSLADLGKMVWIVLGLLIRRERAIQNVAVQIIKGSEIAYTSGILQLQQTYLDQIRTIPFLKEGVSCLIDGMNGADCQELMKRRMMSAYAARMNAAAVLNKAGEIAPAMGLIGTLIGLVQMLSNLSDPTTIGPSMSVALITTFYGALSAYVVFLPLASKLQRDAQKELQLNQVCLVGLNAIDKLENPRRTEIELNSALPPDAQIMYYRGTTTKTA